ncbi:unnamed protein product [Diamesa hyperborea]
MRILSNVCLQDNFTADTIRSAKILLLSRIGPTDHLEELGIEVNLIMSSNCSTETAAADTAAIEPEKKATPPQTKEDIFNINLVYEGEVKNQKIDNKDEIKFSAGTKVINAGNIKNTHKGNIEAGTIGIAKIILLSRIGQTDHLEELGIEVNLIMSSNCSTETAAADTAAIEPEKKATPPQTKEDIFNINLVYEGEVKKWKYQEYSQGKCRR